LLQSTCENGKAGAAINYTGSNQRSLILNQASSFNILKRSIQTSQILSKLPLSHMFKFYLTTKLVTDNEAKVVNVPPFADSISEGDVRWDKGNISV